MYENVVTTTTVFVKNKTISDGGCCGGGGDNNCTKQLYQSLIRAVVSTVNEFFIAVIYWCV